jgi:hypothetical protein
MGTNNLRGKRLIWGIGINDVDAPTWMGNGKRVRDPYYGLWKRILERCYSPQYKKRYPAYIGVTMHSDWHRFSKFKEWVDNQPQKDWRDLYLDKDLRVKDNRVYGPDTCCFLTHQENSIFKPSIVPLGCASYKKDVVRKSPWQSVSEIGYASKRFSKSLGCYTTKEEAEVVAGKESIRRIMEIVNANPHQFIREAMMRWVEEWKQELLLREERWAEIQNSKVYQTNSLPLFLT